MSRASDRVGGAGFSTAETRSRAFRRCGCCGRSSTVNSPATEHPSATSPSTRPSSIRRPAGPWPSVVAAGLLTKANATDDQRRCVLVLTDVGRKALATVTDRRRELVAETIADWPDADVDTLVTLLERLTERFEFSAGR